MLIQLVKLQTPNLQIALPDGGLIRRWMLVAADWNSLQFGEEYLSLQQGEWLRVLPGIVEGWAFAFSPRLSSYGLYPATYAAEAASVNPLDEVCL